MNWGRRVKRLLWKMWFAALIVGSVMGTSIATINYLFFSTPPEPPQEPPQWVSILGSVLVTAVIFLVTYFVSPTFRELVRGMKKRGSRP